MKKIKVLNLYAGIGGNRKLWPNEEIEVTAVEIDPKIAEIYTGLRWRSGGRREGEMQTVNASHS